MKHWKATRKCDLTDDATKMSMESAKAGDAANLVTDATKIVIEAGEKAGMAALQLQKARERHRNVAQVFDKVEEETKL